MKHIIYSAFLTIFFFNTSGAAQEIPGLDPFKRPPRYVPTEIGLRSDTPRPKSPQKQISGDDSAVTNKKTDSE
tara:strand:+ start:21156 stop:21374 length:219 start_codon:yes stop_codon:yes gene_type:complete